MRCNSQVTLNFLIFFFLVQQRMVHVNTCHHLNSFFQSIQLTWLNVVVPRAAGQDSEFATKGLQYTALQEGGTSLPKPKYTGCCQSQQAVGENSSSSFYQDVHLMIYWFPSSCHSWKCERVPQPEAASMEQLPGSWSAEALEPAVQTVSQQDTWVMVKAPQSRNFWDSLTLYTVWICLCKRDIFRRSTTRCDLHHKDRLLHVVW